VLTLERIATLATVAPGDLSSSDNSAQSVLSDRHAAGRLEHRCAGRSGETMRRLVRWAATADPSILEPSGAFAQVSLQWFSSLRSTSASRRTTAPNHLRIRGGSGRSIGGRLYARDRVECGSRKVRVCRDVGHGPGPGAVLLFAAQAMSPSHILGRISGVPHHVVSFNRTRRGRVPPDWRGCVGERDPRTACPRTGGLLALWVERRPCASD
jgi:hypothetical protein